MSEKEKKKIIKRVNVDDGVIERLEETVRKIGIEIRYEHMHKPGYCGGLCRVKKSWVLIINRSSMPLEKAELLADAISTRETNNIYLSPDVREIIEWVAERRRKNGKKEG